jgi:uncharacterized membrane protein HdeD (DUF308 family)
VPGCPSNVVDALSSHGPTMGGGVSLKPLPTWHRALDVTAGALAILLALIALTDPASGILLLVFLFAFALLVIGSWRLTRAMAHADHPGWQRTVDAVLGVFGILVAFLVLLLPGLGVLTLVLLLYFGLVFIGIGWIIFGTRRASEPGWYRGLSIALGVFSLAAALVALVDVRVAVLTLIFFLALVLLLIGVGDLISGVTGRPYRSLPIGLLPPNPGNR